VIQKSVHLEADGQHIAVGHPKHHAALRVDLLADKPNGQ
jgi:hypothetical protein